MSVIRAGRILRRHVMYMKDRKQVNSIIRGPTPTPQGAPTWRAAVGGAEA